MTENIDYTTVTEAPGNRVRREAIDMVVTRYGFAAQHSADKRVLEVACGAGHGLGWIANEAAWVVGGDYTPSLLESARAHYGMRVPLVRLDAQALPFRDGSFDVILLFEALYYLQAPERVLAECRRVLGPSGTLLISSVNCRWADFNPSPFSVKYYSAPELRALLAAHGFETEVYGAFSVAPDTVRDKIVVCVKRVAVALHLVPKTMKGKEFLKRLFYGELFEFPREVQPGQGVVAPLVPIAEAAAAAGFKVLYAVARPH